MVKIYGSLIFFIFMIWFIMRIVKNKQKAAGQNDPKHTQGSNTPGSAATRTGSTYSTAAGRAKKSAYESAMAFQKTATGSYPVMKPDSVNKILTAIGDISQQMAAQNMNYVILTSPKIRLAFRKLIAFNFPDVAVLSLNEIPNEIAISLQF